MTAMSAVAAVVVWAGAVAVGGGSRAALGQQVIPTPPTPALEGPAAAVVPSPADAAAVPEGVEVLTRGPVHEAFAEPVVFNPEPGFVVDREPPPSVEELPPAQKPEGDDVVWIPGYWAWDDTRDDYLWVSGIWRKLPPGRQWVPGYWARVEGGYQWVSGYWAPLEQEEVEYLPTPPETLEVGPNVPAPGEEYVWNPGYWSWYEQRYVWSPGAWVRTYPEWIWIPPSYRYTPVGCVFVPGFWDYALADRGMLFAPAYFGPAYFARPAVVFTPSIVINVAVITDNFFCRPSYGHFFFGDYYAWSGAGQAYQPWFAFQQGGFGYDPVFAWSAARRAPGWTVQVRERYYERVVHTEYRPPHTYREYQRWDARRQGVGNGGVPPLARTLAQVEAVGEIRQARLEQVDAVRRSELTRRTELLDQFRARRAEQETIARKRVANAGAVTEARRVAMDRSPLAASRISSGERFANVQEAAAEATRRRQETINQLQQRRQAATTDAAAARAGAAEATRARTEAQRSNLADALRQRQELQRQGQAAQIDRRQQAQSNLAEAARQRQEQRATLDQRAQQALVERRQAAETATRSRLDQQQAAQIDRRQDVQRQLQERRDQAQAGQVGPRVIVPGAGAAPTATPLAPNPSSPGTLIDRRQQALQQQAEQAQSRRDALEQQAAQRQQQLDAQRRQQEAARQQQVEGLRRQQQEAAQRPQLDALRQQQAEAARQRQINSVRRQQLDALRRQQENADRRQQFDALRQQRSDAMQRRSQFEAPRGAPTGGMQRPFSPPQGPQAGQNRSERRQQATEELQRRREQLRGPRP